MAIPTLVTKGGSLTAKDRNGDVALTGSGALRAVPFDGAQGWLVEDATTNYADNPAYAKTVTYYAGLGATKEYLADARAPIGRAYKVTWDGAAGATAVLADTNTFFSVPGGSAWTLSLKMWSDTVGGVTCTMQINAEYTDGTTQSSVSQAPVALTSSPQTVVRTFTPNGAKTVRRLYLIPTVTSASSISVACQQWENKPYATTYCDGSLGPGYAWTGTAHASASTRAVASFTSPFSVVSLDAGAMYIRHHNLGFGPQNGGVVVRTRRTDALETPFIGVSQQSLMRNLDFSSKVSNSDPSWGVRVQSVADFATYSSYIAWDGYDRWSRLAAESIVHNVDDARASDSAYSPNQLTFGAIVLGGAQNYNGVIGPVLIYDRPLTDAERATLDATPTALLGWDTLIPRIGGMLRVGSPTVLAATRENHTVPIGALRVGFDDTL